MSTGGKPRFGTVEGAVLGLFSRSATVTAVTDVGPRFRRVGLSGPALRGATWSPGDKLQIMLGGWENRTYTPLRWDAAQGTTELLVHLHEREADGMGAGWGRALAPGDEVTVFGPRDSLSVKGLAKPVLFGDETSLGLAVAIRAAQVLLEVASKADVEPVLAAFDLAHVRLFERRPGDAHLADVEEALATRARDEGLESLVLTGKAPSIQRVNRHARQTLGLGSRSIRTRAYWSPGKKGLD